MEIWKEIEGYEGLYEVSNYGSVKSLNYNKTRKEKILKPYLNTDGYLNIDINKKQYKVHRLVAQAFIPNPQNLPQVNHKDEDKTNNHSTNLEWCTAEYNINYSHSKQIICIETGQTYSSIKDAALQLNLNSSYISNACKGRYKKAYGYTWRYI